MHFTSTTRIACPADQAWRIYLDVERWSTWTASITSVELLDPRTAPGTLVVGSRARIVQPRLPVAEWTVTELTEPDDRDAPGTRSFSWVSTGPGVRTTGTHVVRSLDQQTCAATAVLDQDGPVGAVIGLVYARLIRRYLDWETTGLRTLTETGATGSA